MLPGALSHSASVPPVSTAAPVGPAHSVKKAAEPQDSLCFEAFLQRTG